MKFFHLAFFLSVMLGFLFTSANGLHAGPLNQWKISCGVDNGSITKRAGIWTFQTSSNHCPGGVFRQRAEISTRHIRASHKGAYLFESFITMTTSTTEKFDVFQIHDGRDGCSPPLKVTVLRSGQIELTSDVKTGPGESCIRGKLGTGISHGRIRRDGTEQKLEVLIDFDGTGAFNAVVTLDGVVQISGRYEPSPLPQAFLPQQYYFKHGVYSYNVFSYVMQSRDMRVRRVRLQY